MWEWCLLLLPTVLSCFFFKLSNFKGNSDIERYQMANKKIPFKYTRPVEDWLQEKGKHFTGLLECSLFLFLLFTFPVMSSACSLRPLNDKPSLKPFKQQVNSNNCPCSFFYFGGRVTFYFLLFPFCHHCLNYVESSDDVQLKGLAVDLYYFINNSWTRPFGSERLGSVSCQIST